MWETKIIFIIFLKNYIKYVFSSGSVVHERCRAAVNDKLKTPSRTSCQAECSEKRLHSH